MRPAVQALVASRPTARSSTSATATPTAAARSPPTGSSPGAGSRPTSTSRASPTSRSTTCTPLLLRFPEPYDFEISTERFRAFGPDVANLWHEGGLHRVVGGREVRIEAAPGGVRVSPHSTRDRAGGADAARRSRSTSTPFYRWSRRATRSCGGSRRRSRASGRRSRRIRSRASSRRSRRSRSRSSPPSRSATASSSATASGPSSRTSSPTRERVARAKEDRPRRARVLAPQGRVRGRARALRSRPRRARAAAGRRGESADRRRAWARRVDRRLVPGQAPRPAARLAVGRPGTAEGGRRVLW